MAGSEDDDGMTRWSSFRHQFSSITEIELATLKIHVVIEGILRYLLAARLGIPENKLEELRLRFEIISELALAGVGGHLIGGVRALNEARKEVAHRIANTDVLHEKLEIFVREIGYMKKKKVEWPNNQSEQLLVLKDALDDVALAIFLLASEPKNQQIT